MFSFVLKSSVFIFSPSPPRQADFHWCCLLVSLALRCGDVSVGKRGGGATRSNGAGCISAPPIKWSNARSYKIKKAVRWNECGAYLRPRMLRRKRSLSSGHLFGKRIRHKRFPSFLSVPPPFSWCAGKLIYETAWRSGVHADENTITQKPSNQTQKSIEERDFFFNYYYLLLWIGAFVQLPCNAQHHNFKEESWYHQKRKWRVIRVKRVLSCYMLRHILCTRTVSSHEPIVLTLLSDVGGAASFAARVSMLCSTSGKNTKHASPEACSNGYAHKFSIVLAQKLKCNNNTALTKKPFLLLLPILHTPYWCVSCTSCTHICRITIVVFQVPKRFPFSILLRYH